MRYERKVAALSSALGILLVIWVLGVIFSPERGLARSESVKLVSGKIADAAAIELTNPDAEAIKLEKSGDSWSLVDGTARLPVQGSRVKNLLDSIAEPGRLRVVGRSKAAWTDFKLEDDKAKRVLVTSKDGAAIADVYIGAYSSAASGVYVRRAGSELSYVADSSLASYIGYGRSSWLDLKVLGSLTAADVQSVSMRAKIALDGAGKTPLSFEYSARRDGQSWKIGASEADAQAVESMIRSIVSVQGEDIAASPPSDAFSAVSAHIEIALSSGVSKVIEVGAPAADERFYLRAAGNPLVYLASAYSLRSMLKPPADLIKKK
jgi:hypothetical protein